MLGKTIHHCGQKKEHNAFVGSPLKKKVGKFAWDLGIHLTTSSDVSNYVFVGMTRWTDFAHLPRQPYLKELTLLPSLAVWRIGTGAFLTWTNIALGGGRR